MHKRSISQGCEAAEADEENGEREISGEEGSNSMVCVSTTVFISPAKPHVPTDVPKGPYTTKDNGKRQRSGRRQ